MIGALAGFIAELRDAGVPVSTREVIDASEAVREIPLMDRAALRSALAATLVKSPEHRPPFDVAFEIYFSLGRALALAPDAGLKAEPAGGEVATVRSPAGRSTEALTAAELDALVREALLSGADEQLRTAATLAVDLLGGVEAARPVGLSYYLHKIVRALGLEELLADLLRAALLPASPEAARLGLSGTGPLLERFAVDELDRRAAVLRELIERQIRRELVEGRGAGAVAKSARRPLLEEVDFMHATREELAAMRRAIYPLARILAARLARRRRHRRKGPLDFRATIRRSLSQGGAPFDLRFKPPHPARPELFVFADLSGSVASFARFTVLLVYAISAEFSKVRTAVFIDGVDEVTSLLRRSNSIAEAIERLGREADVVRGDGHSDYGSAFELFHERFAHQLSAKTDLLVLGDARNNYHEARTEVLADLQRRAHRVLWLNPEPRAYWGSGESIIAEYARFCDGVFECRNLRQLQTFVEELV